MQQKMVSTWRQMVEETSFLSHQKERIENRLHYYEGLSETSRNAKPPEYIAQKKKLITRTKEALARLEQGLYGVCKICGETISRKRLLAIPAALFCRKCQEQSERDTS